MLGLEEELREEIIRLNHEIGNLKNKISLLEHLAEKANKERYRLEEQVTYWKAQAEKNK